MPTLLSPENKRLISEKLNETFEKSKILYPSLKNWVKPGWHTRLSGTCAGQADLRNNVLLFNPDIFLRNKEHFLKIIVPHEVAHLVAFRVFGDTGHGPDWKRVMVRLGLPPDRCHNYDVSDLKRVVTVSRYIYSCKCREHEFTPDEHKKASGLLKKGKITVFSCKLCRSKCVYQNRIKKITK